MKISIVIPTYNHANQLSEVIDCLFKSQIDEIESIEVIVVDDGSDNPAKSVVESKKAASPFSLRYVFQENAGPAAARNRGFHEASNEIVLFIDDDILVFPDLIKNHLEAHQIYNGAVICGQSPYLIPEISSPAFRYLNMLFNDGLKSIGKENFIKVDIVASGNISVEKGLFERGHIYCESLKIPAGEEFELSFYLKEKGVPVYFAKELKGWHLQPSTIEDSCVQNYKYGLGIAELAVKKPQVLRLRQPRRSYEANAQIRKEDSLSLKIKKSLRKKLVNTFVREKMLSTVKRLENVIPHDRFLFVLYRWVVGTYFAAGIVDGRKLFKKENSECLHVASHCRSSFSRA